MLDKDKQLKTQENTQMDMLLMLKITLINFRVIQKLISGLREELNGKLTFTQKIITKILGYSYIAYEHARSDILSKNMLKRNQTWFFFMRLLIRKTSNKFFRGIKHIILEFIYGK